MRELILACALNHEKCISDSSSRDDAQSLSVAGHGQFCSCTEGHWFSVACPSKEWAMAGSVLSLGRALNDDGNALAASNAS